jgi:dsDNA-binding SOS-regulon protein
MRKVGMSDVQPTIEDEIDLFELAEILWREKVILGCFLAVALVVGCLWISINKKTYETVIGFEIITLSPSESNAQVVADLHKEFHSKDTFSQWSKTMPNAKLQLEDVLPTVLINDVVFASDIDKEALVLILDDKILIRSNETSLILDTLDYAHFVGDVLSQRYSKNDQDEYDRLLALSDRLYERPRPRVIACHF